MSQTGASGHDGSLVDGHGVFGVASNNGVTGFMIRCDLFVLLVYFCTPSLRTFKNNKDKQKYYMMVSLSWKQHQKSRTDP